MYPDEERILLSLIHVFMTAPHKEFPRENCTTLQAGIRILSPVNELRPGQALCSRTQKDPHARPREYFPSRHTILQNILESTHGFRDIHDAQPARGGYHFYQLLLVHGSVFISCFFAQAKIAFSDRKGTGKALSRLSPQKRVARVPLHIRHVYPVQPLPACLPGRHAAGGVVTCLYPLHLHLSIRQQ